MAHDPTASISSLDELMASSHNKKPSWAVRDRAQSAKFFMETNLFDLFNYSASPICSLSCKTKFLVSSSNFWKGLIYLFKWFWKRVSLTYVDVHTKGSTWRVAHVLGREKFNNSSIERPRISCYFLSLSSIRSSLALQLKLGFALIPSTKYHVNDNRRGFLDYYF